MNDPPATYWHADDPSAAGGREESAWLDGLIDAAHRTWEDQASAQDRACLARFEAQRISGGLNNPLFRFRLDGRWRCLKLHLVDARQRALREWRALRLLSDRGRPIVPRPLHYRRSETRPAVVMEFLPGDPLGDRTLSEAQMEGLHTALDGMYALTPDHVNGAVPDVVTTAERMLERVCAHWAALAARTPADATQAGLLDAWAAWIAGPEPQILRLSAPRVFGRGDPNLANCLWDGARVALVDFEYSGWTDRAFELGDLVEHPQSRATPDASWEQLIHRFGLTERERPRCHAARRLLCLFWLARWWPAADQPGASDRFAAQVRRTRKLLAEAR